MNINYEIKAILVALFVLLAWPVYSQSYADNYDKECAGALDFYRLNNTSFEQIAKITNLSKAFLFAIVAPEYTQFNHLKDKLETYSLKVFYVQKGKEYANFSVGFFQMKPSFVEQMEDSLRINEPLKRTFEKCLIPNPGSREARVERLKRLEQLEWQLTYLALFCELVKQRFIAPENLSEEALLPFYATAYNAGFHKSASELNRMAQYALFPYFSKQKFNYSDIAVWFYQKMRE